MADNTTLNAGAGGDVIATDDIGGVKYQRVKLSIGADGAAADVHAFNPLPVNLIDDSSVYRLVVPPQAVGANKVYLDFFNATGTGVSVRVKSAFAFNSNDVAVTGTLGVRLHLTRTTAIGTGGTAATADGSSLTAGTITKLDPALAALPAGVTARVAPAGGATAGALVAIRHVFTEETNTGAALTAAVGAEFIRVPGADLIVPENTGFRFVQGSVASVGNIGFEVNFDLI